MRGFPHSTPPAPKILRRDIEKLGGYTRSFVIYDDDDQGAVLKEILKRQNIDDKLLPIRELKAKISDAKNKLMGPDEWFDHSDRDFRCQQIHTVFVEYEARLKTLNALDFDDLLVKTLELLADHPPVLDVYRKRFQYVMVDEYQDTNYAQYMLVKLLTDTRVGISALWAMTTSRFTAGAARISAISLILRRIIPTRPSSS